ncbi:Chloride channel protein CLC-e [Porphyridium purpureum]|uniref:Chloride channel protein n=1 Tax=Porphyridium purpureum TaxID=35688 RepID=A0A5J4Z6K8_PORPP|nr:Chloride channel protein CLC-e [Porphyridium purpureum]|eukprot:POR5832..scf295_1
MAFVPGSGLTACAACGCGGTAWFQIRVSDYVGSCQRLNSRGRRQGRRRGTQCAVKMAEEPRYSAKGLVVKRAKETAPSKLKKSDAGTSAQAGASDSRISKTGTEDSSGLAEQRQQQGRAVQTLTSSSPERGTQVPAFELPRNESISLFVLAAMVGSGTGLMITLFKNGIHSVMHVAYGDLVAGALLPYLHEYNVIMIPFLGGLAVAGIRSLVGSFGGGLAETIKDNEQGVPVNMKRTAAKASAAIVTLGSGCSLGPEGPAVEIGASVSRIISQYFELSPERRRIILASGAAAGVAAGFNAPIAGVFFAQELVLGKLQNVLSQPGTVPPTQIITVLLLSSSISALIAQVGLGSNPAFVLPQYELRNPVLELPLYIGLGLVVGMASFLFKQVMKQGVSLFDAGPLAAFPRSLKPALGGLACGVVAVFYPQILFFGYDTLDALLADTEFPLALLVALIFLKPAMTSISLGSGLVGGIFAPSMFLGATIGASYNKILTDGYDFVTLTLFKTFGAQSASALIGSFSIAGPPAYSVVGMAAALAGVFGAPLTGFLLLFELTRDYRIVLPLMASVGFSTWAVDQFERGQEEKKKRQLQESSSDAVPASKTSVSCEDAAGGEGRRTKMPNAQLSSSSSVSTSGEGNELELVAQDQLNILDSLLVQDHCRVDIVVLDEMENLQGAFRRLYEAKQSVALVARRSAGTSMKNADESNRTFVEELEALVCYGIVTLDDISTAFARFRASTSATDRVAASRTPARDNGRAGGKVDEKVVCGEGPELEYCLVVSQNFTDVLVRDVCTEDVLFVYKDMSLAKAYQIMTSRGIRQLPVVSDESGEELVGLIGLDQIRTAYLLENARRNFSGDI